MPFWDAEAKPAYNLDHMRARPAATTLAARPAPSLVGYDRLTLGAAVVEYARRRLRVPPGLRTVGRRS